MYGKYKFPFVFKPQNGVNILIPQSRMQNFLVEKLFPCIFIQTPNYKEIKKNIEAYLKQNGLDGGIYVFDTSEPYEEQRNLAAFIRLFSSLFLILLTVIACANIFNIVTASLNRRKKEFAVLRSLGITLSRLFLMLCSENLIKAAVAAFFGAAISLPMSYIIYRGIVVNQTICFRFPVRPYIIACIAMLFVMLAVSVYSIYKLKNRNIITDIRNDFT